MSVFMFILSLLASFILSALLLLLFTRLRIVDNPKRLQRKIHKKPTALGGGLAIYLVVSVVGSIALFVLPGSSFAISLRTWIGVVMAGLVLFIGGIIDDKYGISAKKQLIAPISAVIVVLIFGVGLESISNPIGQAIDLTAWKLSLGALGNVVLLADMIVFFWLMSMMYTTKLLDGLDGLVTGMTAIGSGVIWAITSTGGPIPQPEVALLAAIVCGACLGFLPWNWHRASMFLGEGGSLYTGFILGMLAIISGSKFVTTVLIMGIPMLDIIRVLLTRYKQNKSLFVGDKEHLHFKLVDKGFSPKQTVYMFYAIAALFGMSSLFLQQAEKFVALGILGVLMLVIALWFSKQSYETNH